MKVGITEYTPETAMSILNNQNSLNVRSMRMSVAEKYARDMKNGGWEYSWDCIAFDKDGNLLNGQHRLKAVVISGCTVDMLTIYGAENITGDVGLKRTAGEEIRSRGGEVSDFVFSNYGTGIVRAVYRFFLGISNATPSEIEDFVNLPRWKDCEKVAKALQGAPKGVNTSKVAAALIGAYLITNNNEIYDFIKVLSTGIAETSRCASVIALRDYLMSSSNNGTGKRRDATQDIKYTQGAFRAYINGNKAKRLYKTEMLYKPTMETFEGGTK